MLKVNGGAFVPSNFVLTFIWLDSPFSLHDSATTPFLKMNFLQASPNNSNHNCTCINFPFQTETARLSYAFTVSCTCHGLIESVSSTTGKVTKWRHKEVTFRRIMPQTSKPQIVKIKTRNEKNVARRWNHSIRSITAIMPRDTTYGINKVWLI
jgi:hypothetical protein